MTDMQSRWGGQITDAAKRCGQPLRLRSIVLLAGGVQATSLAAQVGRSVLDLPIADSLRLLDVWRLRLGEFFDACGIRAEARILAGSTSALPTVVTGGEHVSFRAERDASRYRGTAGALRDLYEQFEEEDHILVATASQCPGVGQLERLLRTASSADGVTLGVDAGGTPTGLMLMRCSALQEIASVGYVDLKEQALMRIAERSGVRVVQVPGTASRTLRTSQGYLDAVRSWHCTGDLAGVGAANPFAERWKPAFSIVEPGAEVGPGARLHDSVVLAGGSIGPACDVVRCVIGPGGRLRKKQRLVGEVVVAKEAAREGLRDNARGSQP